MQDFEPYFCTVEDCTTPFDISNTFNGLLDHLQSHLTQRYHIDLPNGKHYEVDEEGFEKYLLQHTDTSVETSLAMKEASYRKGVFVFQTCPFCGGFPDNIQKRFPEPVAPKAQLELRQHIKRHMEDIALFLPPYREDEEVVPQSSAFSRIFGEERSILGPSEDFRITCDLAICDCKDFGENPEESASTSEVIPGLDVFTASNDAQSDEKDTDFWVELFPELPRYDKSRVGDEYYLQDKHLSLLAASQGSIDRDTGEGKDTEAQISSFHGPFINTFRASGVPLDYSVSDLERWLEDQDISDHPIKVLSVAPMGRETQCATFVIKEDDLSWRKTTVAPEIILDDTFYGITPLFDAGVGNAIVE